MLGEPRRASAPQLVGSQRGKGRRPCGIVRACRGIACVARGVIRCGAPAKGTEGATLDDSLAVGNGISPTNVVWINIEEPTDDEITQLAERSCSTRSSSRTCASAEAGNARSCPAYGDEFHVPSTTARS